MALPIIGALGALGLVASPLAKLAGVFGMGGGEGEGDDSNQKILDKLDELISEVKKGQVITMDGNKVGRNLAMVSSMIG